MKLLHLANHHSTNVGNGALILGTERVLREDLGPVEFHREPWDEYTLTATRRFDESFVDKVNATDCLLVGGAVSLNGRQAFTNAGMRLDLPFHLWSKIERPIVFYGLSYRVWPGQQYRNLDALRRTVRKLLPMPQVLFGVRNDGTKHWLENLLGFKSDAILEVPDPALWVPAAGDSRRELDTGRSNVVLSLNNEDAVYRYGGALRQMVWPALSGIFEEQRLARLWERAPIWRHRRRRMLHGIAAALDRLSQKRDLALILCPHYFDDYTIMGEFASLCTPRIAHQLMTSVGLAKVDQTEHFYSIYSGADLALSMRVHSLSPSIGLGTPVIALSSQARIEKFMSDAGLGDLTLDVFDEGLEDRLLACAEACLDQPGAAKARISGAREHLRRRAAQFNNRLALLLGSTARSEGT